MRDIRRKGGDACSAPQDYADFKEAAFNSAFIQQNSRPDFMKCPNCGAPKTSLHGCEWCGSK